MGREYYDDILDVALKHAGRELLLDMACHAAPVSDEALFSEGFEKKMTCIINAESRRKRTRKAFRIAARAAAVLLIVLFISSAVVFSSEALRTKVFNMFANIGKDSVDIGSYETTPGESQQGMIIPGYMPEGFSLVESIKIGDMRFKSKYKDPIGNTIVVQQMSASASILVDNDGNAYETEISGVNAVVAENDDNVILTFVYKEYAFVLTGYTQIELSELTKIAQSIILNC